MNQSRGAVSLMEHSGSVTELLVQFRIILYVCAIS